MPGSCPGPPSTPGQPGKVLKSSTAVPILILEQGPCPRKAMKIQGDSQRPVDPPPRNRPVVPPAVASDTPPSVPISSGSDHADVATSPGEISRYVQIIKAMNPLDSAK